MPRKNKKHNKVLGFGPTLEQIGRLQKISRPTGAQISKHARIRCRQRGFQSDHLDFIINNGSAKEKPGGVVEYRLTNKDKMRIQSQLKRQLQALDKLSKKAVIVSCVTGEVVTAYNLTR